MARPRKDSGIIEAKQRICDAYWELLETNRFQEITVGMLVGKAGCNRGTFYYHFDNMDHLVDQLIERCIVENRTLTEIMASLLTNQNVEQFMVKHQVSLSRLALMIRQGGMEQVYAKFRELTLALWTKLLCDEGEELKPETRLIIEFAANGIAGISAYLTKSNYEIDIKAVANSKFIIDAPRFFLQEICATQGVNREDFAKNVLALKLQPGVLSPRS